MYNLHLYWICIWARHEWISMVPLLLHGNVLCAAGFIGRISKINSLHVNVYIWSCLISNQTIGLSDLHCILRQARALQVFSHHLFSNSFNWSCWVLNLGLFAYPFPSNIVCFCYRCQTVLLFCILQNSAKIYLVYAAIKTSLLLCFIDAHDAHGRVWVDPHGHFPCIHLNDEFLVLIWVTQWLTDLLTLQVLVVPKQQTSQIHHKL